MTKLLSLVAVALCLGVLVYLTLFAPSEFKAVDQGQQAVETGASERTLVDVEQEVHEATPPPKLAPKVNPLWDMPDRPFGKPEAPPGLVLVAGGQFAIGATTESILALIAETQMRPLASEAPQYKATLDSFYIMATEVTNEQYERFVLATGAAPPESWGGQAIATAALNFATSMGVQKKQARAAGAPIPQFDSFDRRGWWRANAAHSKWSIPVDQVQMPVTYINYQQAVNYATWAGLRLISEEEFQAAARGTKTSNFPWGETLLSGHANTVEANLGKASPVGGFPNGSVWFNAVGKRAKDPLEINDRIAAEVVDLVGNVWEWTRSPFLPHPGFTPLDVVLHSGRERLAPEWDADRRCASGGSYELPSLANRISVRRGTDRGQATAGLGMRCSLAENPTRTVAENVLQTLALSLPLPGIYAPKLAVGISKWTYERGTARPKSYRVITDFNHLTFIPKVGAPNRMQELESQSRDGAVELGLLSMTIDLLYPKLEAGTYSLVWVSDELGQRDNQAVLYDTKLTGYIEARDLADRSLVMASFPCVPITRSRQKVEVPTHARISPGMTGSVECEIVHFPLDPTKGHWDRTRLAFPLAFLVGLEERVDQWQ